MRHATPLFLALALAAASNLQGCFTSTLWYELDGDLDVTAEEVVTWSRTHDEGFRVVVRYADDSEVPVDVKDQPGTPVELLRGSYGGFDAPRSAARLRLAVQRGLVTRAFATDPRLARLTDQPDFLAATLAPVVSPTFAVGPTSSDVYRELQLRGDDRETIRVELLDPEWSDAGPGDVALVVLGTPFTFALDVVTSPVQLVLLLAIGEVVGGAGAHH